jgi:iron complex outermembrane receptor protein
MESNMRQRNGLVVLFTPLVCLLLTAGVYAQNYGTIRGTVKVADTGTVLHNVIVTVVQLRRSVETDENGAFEIQQVPPGTYTLLTHMEGFPDVARTVTVTSGATATSDFEVRLLGLREELTVTATGSEQSTFEALQSVNTLDAIRIAESSHPSLGEVLDKEPGVAKRSFGPGSSRPVVRGFDGDRVLVLQDGGFTGSLGSQSGDHGEPIDVLSLERIEVVKGPATLLYGSNAVGGVVNAITGHDYAHDGWRGYFTGIGGTTNSQGGASGGLEYGTERWMFWGHGTAQRTGDYDTPAGRIENSGSRDFSGLVGTGRYADKNFFSLTYGHDTRRYGIPFASFFESGGEETGSNIDVSMRRHDLNSTAAFATSRASSTPFASRSITATTGTRSWRARRSGLSSRTTWRHTAASSTSAGRAPTAAASASPVFTGTTRPSARSRSRRPSSRIISPCSAYRCSTSRK